MRHREQSLAQIGQEARIAPTTWQQASQTSQGVDPASYGGPSQAALGEARPRKGRERWRVIAKSPSQWSLSGASAGSGAGASGSAYVELVDDLGNTQAGSKQGRHLGSGGSALDDRSVAHIPAQSSLQLIKGNRAPSEADWPAAAKY